MSLMKGNSEANAIVAASAVLPDPEGPWTSTLTSGVRSEVRTCPTYKFPSRRMFCSIRSTAVSFLRLFELGGKFTHLNIVVVVNDAVSYDLLELLF